MGWDADDVEDVAAQVYEMAGADPDDPPGPVALADAIGIEIRPAKARSLWGDAELCRVNASHVIYVPPRLPPARLGYAIAHELAELVLKLREMREDGIEQLANAAATAILAPRRLFIHQLKITRDDIAIVARCFVATESAIALRIGEARGDAIALVSPKLVRLRGGEFVWPAANEIRKLARAKVLPFPLTRTKLTDEDGRVVLRATGLLALDAVAAVVQATGAAQVIHVVVGAVRRAGAVAALDAARPELAGALRLR